jgi:nucleotide-binding universal stress UspA family protein
MKILLALDPATSSQAALEEIALRLWPPQTTVEVITVVEPSHLWTASATAAETSRRAQDQADQAAEYLRSNGLTATAATLIGHAKAALVDRARATQAALIFAGSHGSSRLKQFVLGSVAGGLLREAPCSVAIVRGPSGRKIQKILLATDGSKQAERAACSIARRPWHPDTEVRVLSAVELVLPATYAWFEPPNFDTEFLEALRCKSMKRSQESVAAARSVLESAGLKTSESISVLWEPARAIILDEAAKWDADLIVLGSHGHRGVERVLLGSVSEGVAMHADCTVEVIR